MNFKREWGLFISFSCVFLGGWWCKKIVFLQSFFNLQSSEYAIFKATKDQSWIHHSLYSYLSSPLFPSSCSPLYPAPFIRATSLTYRGALLPAVLLSAFLFSHLLSFFFILCRKLHSFVFLPAQVVERSWPGRLRAFKNFYHLQTNYESEMIKNFSSV